jgi:hypothetical protein
VVGGDGSGLKLGAWASCSFVIETFNCALLPSLAGTSRKLVKSTATSFAPRPRTPPTPTTKALTWPLLSSKMSMTSPTLWFVLALRRDDLRTGGWACGSRTGTLRRLGERRRHRQSAYGRKDNKCLGHICAPVSKRKSGICCPSLGMPEITPARVRSSGSAHGPRCLDVWGEAEGRVQHRTQVKPWAGRADRVSAPKVSANESRPYILPTKRLYALPARTRRPGSAPVCSPSSKIGIPATKVARYPSTRCTKRRPPAGRSCTSSGW